MNKHMRFKDDYGNVIYESIYNFAIQRIDEKDIAESFISLLETLAEKGIIRGGDIADICGTPGCPGEYTLSEDK